MNETTTKFAAKTFGRFAAAFGLAVVLGSIAIACGPGTRGDSCDEEGSTQKCADGICGKGEGGELQCLQICFRNEDCLSGEDCVLVGESGQKGCAPSGGGDEE